MPIATRSLPITPPDLRDEPRKLVNSDVKAPNQIT